MLVPIKSMINEMYSKDLSQKIQSCFRSKEARGEIYTPVPFGYKKDQKNHLVLDDEVSDVVVRIFLWKKSGMKEREIARKNSSGREMPTECRKMKEWSRFKGCVPRKIKFSSL